MPPQTKPSLRLQGIPVSPGIHIGRVVAHEPQSDAMGPRRIAARDVEAEVERLRAAVELARGDITALRSKILETLDEAHAAIFDPHLLFLDDPGLMRKIVDRIREGRLGAAHAIQCVIQELADQFGAIPDPYISSRSADVLDVGARVRKRLSGGAEAPPAMEFATEVIVLARDLSPSETAQMSHDRVKGFAMEIGGPTSHTAILAKALQIPAVVGLGPFMSRVDETATAIVDGYDGVLTLNPTPADIRRARNKRRRRLIQERDLRKLRSLHAETIDGYRIELSANVELPSEIPGVLEFGANGIGLFRTEFLYLNRPTMPTEEEQFVVYRDALESVAPGGVIFRTIDIGGDKAPAGMNLNEPNPYMGLRAIRYCLQRPDVFKEQLRALLRAAAHGRAKIMFPMISSLEELLAAKFLLSEARAELVERGELHNDRVEVGVMVELPSAALTADLLAPHVDFFSIGTNDLIQYTLAVDRGNERVAQLYNPFHPAILQLIRRVVDTARRAGIWTGVCGEMASNPMTALLLVGMGINELSMGPSGIPEIKYLLRNIRLAEARTLAQEVYALRNSADVRFHVSNTYMKLRRTRLKGLSPPEGGMGADKGEGGGVKGEG